MILLFIIAVIAVIFGIFYTVRYKNLERDFIKYQKKVERKYIQVDVKLKNAVQEALDSAIERENEFEARAYKELLRSIHSKW